MGNEWVEVQGDLMYTVNTKCLMGENGESSKKDEDSRERLNFKK